ncbi:MAG: hypothetical protein ACI9BK_002914, partial [Acidimicrobiales bacterium]
VTWAEYEMGNRLIDAWRKKLCEEHE